MQLKSIFIFLCIVFSMVAGAQPVELNASILAGELGKPGFEANELFMGLDSTLEHVDSSRANQFMKELERNGPNNYQFQARYRCLQARQLYFRKVYAQFYDNDKAGANLEKAEVKRLFSEAIDIAYRSEDDYLVAFVSSRYGQAAIQLNEIGIAVMYTMNGIELYEKLSYKIPAQDYQFLAEILYRVREYNSSIKYARKAADEWKQQPAAFQSYTISCINTVALGYHRQGIYDSAFIFYNQALALARQINNAVWAGIVSGNIGQLFYQQKKYDTAYALLKMDYATSDSAHYFDNAANSLQWAARTKLAMGDKRLLWQK